MEIELSNKGVLCYNIGIVSGGENGGKTMIVKPCNGTYPVIDENAHVAENAAVIGNVTLAAGVSVWYGAVLRGDACSIRVGENSNVQDCCCIHGETDTVIGRNVTIGHGAIVHGCTVDDNCLIGMGAVILDSAVIGEGSIIGAGALVSEGKVVPPHSLVLGVPGKVVRSVTQEQYESILQNAASYVTEGQQTL